jgi:hypothetical protein
LQIWCPSLAPHFPSNYLEYQQVTDSVKRTRLLIVDDHMIVVEGIRSALSALPGFEVIGSALDGIDGIRKFKVLKPDVVILDISIRTSTACRRPTRSGNGTGMPR